MLEEKLEIVIITYNRAPFLERTLAQLLGSPFARCKITVLDNCSTDDTPHVYRRYQTLFSALNVVRHEKNIGACPNYLRAVEISASPYTWVLCDDDIFDFTDCRDVIAAIEAGEVDVISLCDASSVSGFPDRVDWPRGSVTTTRQFVREHRLFWVCAFVPSLIFKTELFDSECLARGYRNVINLYPHFDFIRKLAQNDFSIYSSKRKMVHRDPHDNAPSGLYWCASWMGSCSTIEDRRLRRMAVYQGGEDRYRWVRGLFYAVVAEKLQYPERVFREYAAIVLACSVDQLLLVSLVAPLVLTPAPIYRLARKLRHIMIGKPAPDPVQPYDYFRI